MGEERRRFSTDADSCCRPQDGTEVCLGNRPNEIFHSIVNRKAVYTREKARVGCLSTTAPDYLYYRAQARAHPTRYTVNICLDIWNVCMEIGGNSRTEGGVDSHRSWIVIAAWAGSRAFSAASLALESLVKHVRLFVS